MKCAALFVRKTSHYKRMAGVDCFDIERDALTWRGGVPGVFHPPCRAWGKLSHFANARRGEKELALWSMAMARRFGGVVEHPKTSRLWAAAGCLSYGLRDDFGGVLIPVYQSWWGHKAPKETCFYVVGAVPELPEYQAPVMVQSVERMSDATSGWVSTEVMVGAGLGVIVVTWIVVTWIVGAWLRNRQHRRLIDMQGSALW